MRSSSLSIATNIAEGCGRQTLPDFKKFLTISKGSTLELGYQILISKDIKYITYDIYEKLDKEINEIKKMLQGYSNSLK